MPGWDPWYYDPWIGNGGSEVLTADKKKIGFENYAYLLTSDTFYT